MMSPKNFVTLVLALSGLLAAGSANADIFRCSDAAGKTLYTNFPARAVHARPISCPRRKPARPRNAMNDANVN
jgi:hypothetical protein